MMKKMTMTKAMCITVQLVIRSSGRMVSTRTISLQRNTRKWRKITRRNFLRMLKHEERPKKIDRRRRI